MKDHESIDELAKALKSANIETIVEFLESVQDKHIALEKKAELSACGEWLSYGENDPVRCKKYIFEDDERNGMIYTVPKSLDYDCSSFLELNGVVRFAEIKE